MGQLKNSTQATVVIGVAARGGTPPDHVAALVEKTPTVNMETTTIERNVANGKYGSQGVAVTASLFKAGIALEMKHLGRSAGTIVEPEWSRFIQACAIKKSAATVITVGAITGTFQVGENLMVGTDIVGVLVDISGSTLRMRNVGVIAVAPTDTLEGETSSATTTVSTVKTALMYEPYQSAADLNANGLMAFMKINESGIEKVINSAMGTGTLTCAQKEIPKISFEFTGFYSNPTDQALVFGNTSNVVPIPFEGVTFEYTGLDPTQVFLTDFSLEFGNQIAVAGDVQQTNSIGAIHCTDIMPKAKLTFSVPSIATFNPYLAHEDGITSRIAIQYGVADKYIHIVIPRAQNSAPPTTSDKDGLLHYSLDMNCRAASLATDTPPWSITIY